MARDPTRNIQNLEFKADLSEYIACVPMQQKTHIGNEVVLGSLKSLKNRSSLVLIAGIWILTACVPRGDGPDF